MGARTLSFTRKHTLTFTDSETKSTLKNVVQILVLHDLNILVFRDFLAMHRMGRKHTNQLYEEKRLSEVKKNSEFCLTFIECFLYSEQCSQRTECLSQ